MQIIFGPVHSRRFGISLGVDLSPTVKQCNFDCLYCELAPMQPIKEQNNVIGIEEILQALEQNLNDKIDVLTLTANGEPTLYPHLKELISQINTIKNNTKTLILSNGATLHKKEVFEALLLFDKVKLSLDAVTPTTFKKIDRPVKGIDIDEIIKNIQKFSAVYQGELYIEILFVKGINDTKEEIKALNTTLKSLKNITRVDLGTIDRPPAYAVEALSYEALLQIAHLFDPSLPVYIASRKNMPSLKQSYTKVEIYNTLDKRPLTFEDIKALFDQKSMQNFQELLQEGSITTKKIENLTFYLPKENFIKKRVKNS